MRTACIVQARLGSSRLPAKVLLSLPTGRMVLEEVLERCWQIPGVDIVVAALPDTAENDILEWHIEDAQRYARIYRSVTVVRGSEHDVLARYALAAEAVSADVVIRITSDCPLLDPGACGFVLKMQQETGAGFVSNSWPVRECPHGHDCEVFTRAALDRANTEATLPGHREHVTPFMQLHERYTIIKSTVDRSSERITLDTLADYVHIWSIFEQQMREAA